MNTQVEALLKQTEAINPTRKKELNHLADQIYRQFSEMGFSKLLFVCTHNSRRSQLAQIWFWQALEYLELPQISAYSGGTETTAFNHRMVKAVEDYGFILEKISFGDNPKYRLSSAKNSDLVLFSKRFEDNFNPQKEFIAVMVCNQADKECPFVPGAYARFSLPYIDPKTADDTPEEVSAYAKKVEEIGREMCFLVALLHEKLN